MAKLDEDYVFVEVETYYASGSGLHGSIHVRPVAGEVFPQTMRVECSRSLRTEAGKRFRMRVKLTDREGEGAYLYSSFRWPVEALN